MDKKNGVGMALESTREKLIGANLSEPHSSEYCSEFSMLTGNGATDLAGNGVTSLKLFHLTILHVFLYSY